MAWCLFPLLHEILEDRDFDLVLFSFVSSVHMVNTQVTWMDGWMGNLSWTISIHFHIIQQVAEEDKS